MLVLGVGVAMLFEQQKADNREAARYGDFKEKVQLLKNAVLKDRCNTATSVELSRVLVSTGHVDEAAAQLNEVVENCPADGSILTRLSRLYRKLGDHAEASRAASKLVLTEKAGDPDGLVNEEGAHGRRSVCQGGEQVGARDRKENRKA